MCSHHDALSARRESPHNLCRLLLVFDIHIRSHLIQEEKGRILRHQHGEKGALPLPARELRDRLIAVLAHIRGVKRRFDFLPLALSKRLKHLLSSKTAVRRKGVHTHPRQSKRLRQIAHARSSLLRLERPQLLSEQAYAPLIRQEAEQGF